MNLLSSILLLLKTLNSVGALAVAPEPTKLAKLFDRAIDGIKAIVPSTSGQIGINPVINDLGDPSTYIGQIIGVDTQWITLDTATVTTVSHVQDHGLCADRARHQLIWVWMLACNGSQLRWRLTIPVLL